MNKPLFRDLRQNNKQQWQGEALVSSIYPGWFINSVSILFIIALICSIVFTSYTRRASVNGEVITQNHPVNIYASQQGYVIERLVNIGDKVTKGTVLYRIDVSQVTDSGKVAQNTIAILESQLKQVDELIEIIQSNKINALKNINDQLEKHKELHKKIQFLANESAKELMNLDQNVEDYKKFLKRGLVKKDEANYQRYLYQQQQNTHQNFYSQLIQEELQITNLTSDLKKTELEFADQILQYEYRRYDLKKQLTELNAADIIVVTAPHDGTVESLTVTSGQMVNLGDSLAQISPLEKNEHYGLLWLPDSAVIHVQAGDKINIRYNALPFEKYGQFPGEIIYISAVPASSQEMLQYTSAPKQVPGEPEMPHYKAIVKLSKPNIVDQNKTLSLTSGMAFQSTVFLDNRPLYQWMFTPYYNIKKSISGVSHESDKSS